MACIAQGLIEVFFCETLECLYVHYFVPRMVSNADIEKVREVLQSCIRKLCESPSAASSFLQIGQVHKIINAPQYFFVSTNFAKSFPMLMESMMVLSYHSHLPGEIGEKWNKHANVNRENERSRSPYSSLSVVFCNFCSWLGTWMVVNAIASIPLEIQKMVIRFFEPIMLGVFAYAITTRYGYYIIGGASALILVLVIYLSIGERVKSKTMQVGDSINNEDKLFLELNQGETPIHNTREQEEGEVPISQRISSSESLASYSDESSFDALHLSPTHSQKLSEADKKNGKYRNSGSSIECDRNEGKSTEKDEMSLLDRHRSNNSRNESDSESGSSSQSHSDESVSTVSDEEFDIVE
jgi:hypothetical protein